MKNSLFDNRQFRNFEALDIEPLSITKEESNQYFLMMKVELTQTRNKVCRPGSKFGAGFVE